MNTTPSSRGMRRPPRIWMNCALWPWTLWGLSAETREPPECQAPTFSFRPQGRTPGREGSPHDGQNSRLPPPEGFQNAAAEIPLAAPPGRPDDGPDVRLIGARIGMPLTR